MFLNATQLASYPNVRKTILRILLPMDTDRVLSGIAAERKLISMMEMMQMLEAVCDPPLFSHFKDVLRHTME